MLTSCAAACLLAAANAADAAAATAAAEALLDDPTGMLEEKEGVRLPRWLGGTEGGVVMSAHIASRCCAAYTGAGQP
jgi:hypothetical protein